MDTKSASRSAHINSYPHSSGVARVFEKMLRSALYHKAKYEHIQHSRSSRKKAAGVKFLHRLASYGKQISCETDPNTSAASCTKAEQDACSSRTRREFIFRSRCFNLLPQTRA